MTKATRVFVYAAAGTVAGYVKFWRGKWYAVEYANQAAREVGGTEAWRRGSFSDRTDAILAVLAARGAALGYSDNPQPTLERLQ
jgi:hypothetical protein